MTAKTADSLTGFSIRTNVMLLTLLPMLVISLVVSIAFISFRLSDLNAGLHVRGADAARHLATAAEFGVITGNRRQLLDLVHTNLDEKDVRAVAIYDKDRALLAQAGPPLLDPATLTASMGYEGSLYLIDDVMRFAHPVRFATVSLADGSNLLEGAAPSAADDGRQVLGWAIVEISRTSTQLAKYRTAFTALMITSLSILLSYLLARHLSDRLTLPIATITRAIGEIKEGKLSTRVQVHGVPEIDQLQEGVNSMAESLDRLRTDMQQNIDQATEDLTETLETIEIQNIELDIARKDALEASRVKSEFLANMSHEIRTPLNGILGFTRLLLKSPLNRQQKDQLNTILKSSEILLTIINDILDFSKIEAGKLVLDHTAVDLQDVVDDVLTMLAPTAHEKNLDLAALVYSDVPQLVLGDPLRLKQVLTNLVNNAIKFTQRGEVMVRVMLEENDRQGRTQIRFAVADTGVGLSRLQQQNLFTPFSQADASTARRHGGTGLGLVISRRLVDQMGGKIGVDSELGKGATFWFTFPVTVSEESAAELTTGPGLLQDERIIYLEHQDKTGLVVESLLHLWGAKVERVGGMAELIEKVMAAQQRNSGYAMAVIGLAQTHLHSLPYAQNIRNLEYKLDCRTLLLVPTPDPLADIPAFFSDVSAVLTKPPTRRRLADTVLTLLRGRDSTTHKGDGANSVVEPQDAPLILAVDDNPANLKLVMALLTELCMRHEGVASGYEALRAVRRQPFDLVFMDVQMPGMDGIETTAKIREIEGSQRHTPIIALTAHALAEEKQMLMQSGFDDYLTKPVDEGQLQQVIERHTGYRFDNQAGRHAEVGGSAHIKPSSRTPIATCVDVAASIRLAGNKQDLAEELFSMLLESLADARRSIAILTGKAAWHSLLEEIHKLHGATRYCGVPLLRQAAASLEAALKRGQQPLEPLISALLAEIDRIEYWVERNDWQREFRRPPGQT